MTLCDGTYSPESSTRKCEWLTCCAGSGLAGRGWCFASGAWWMPCCPAYQEEVCFDCYEKIVEPQINKMRKERYDE